MLVPCPVCEGEGRLEREIKRYGRFDAYLSAAVRTCEACDGIGEVAALCPDCGDELDPSGDCVACRDVCVEQGWPYDRPKPYVPSEEAALRVAKPAKGSFTCEMCGWTFSHDRTVLTVVSASRKAAHNLCAPCVRAIRDAELKQEAK